MKDSDKNRATHVLLALVGIGLVLVGLILLNIEVLVAGLLLRVLGY